MKGKEPSTFFWDGKQNFLPELQVVSFSEPTLKLSDGDLKASGGLDLVY